MTKWTAPDIASIRGDNSRPLQKIFGSLTEYLNDYQINSLDSLSDVTITTPTAGQTLSYDAVNSLWKNATFSNGGGLTNLNASNLASGTVPTGRVAGSYVGITGLGTLTSLTIDGPSSPSVFFGDWNQNNNWSGIRGTFGYLLTGSSGGGDSGIFLRSESASHSVHIGSNNTNTLIVTNTSATVAGTMNATTFSGSGASLTSLPAGQLTGTVASARLSGAYTGITQLGTISPSLTVTGGTGTTITATTQTLINGTNNNAGIYLGGSTGSSSTGGIEASWRDAANPSIAIGVTRDNNRTMTVHSYADSTIRFYAGNSNEAYVNNGGFTANHYYGVIQYGSYGSLSVYGESGGWYGIVFPSQATTWMSAANGQYFGCYRNNSTWNFYVVNGTFTPSDERYKRDIEPLQHGMNLIREIVPVTFDPLTEDPADDPEQTVGRTHYGFTTQNILQALANVGETRDVALVDIGGPANESNESDRQYLNHSGLIAPMVKAIQELDARLQQLETV